MDDAGSVNRSCPSLGLKDDADSSLGFPSNWNYCHHSHPIAAPRFKHQEEFCLSGKHAECPVFLNQMAALPKELRLPRKTSAKSGRNTTRNIVVALLILVAILFAGWGISRSGLLSPVKGEVTLTASPFAAPTSALASPPSITLPLFSIVTHTPSGANAIDSVTTPLSTPAVFVSKNQLEVEIGTDYKFVIHKILEGETMSEFAAKYNTSEEAIVAVNLMKKNPGWSGTLIVIPVRFTDFARLPSFIVYQVQEKDRGISAETMAKYLRVTELELKYYNGWASEGDRPLVGDYLLVPRPRPVQ